jgi:uncharacterized protein
MGELAVQLGVLSDTHGMFDPKLCDLFRGSDFILHAGDVCGQEVLDLLEVIAPVLAIFGNCDAAPLSLRLPPWRTEAIAGHRILILHDLGKPERMNLSASALVAREKPNIVISGHSHQGRISISGDVLFVNPGSAGRKRFKLLRSAAVLSLSRNEARAALFSLESITPTRVSQAAWHRTSARRAASKAHPRPVHPGRFGGG